MNPPARPQRVTGLTGTVVRAPFGSGSKSERRAYWLEQAGGRRVVLRRKAAAGVTDEGLEALVGRRVVCDGFLVDYQLLAERIETAP